MSFRASTGNLSAHDDFKRGPAPERWDRDKFDRISRHAADERERDIIYFKEKDLFAPGRTRHEFEFDERIDRPGTKSRIEEKERFVEDDYYSQSRKRLDPLDYREAVDVANRALAPYRRKSLAERDVDISIRSSTRPQMLRRQSSLDTFDRLPAHRHSHKRDDWRPPTNVLIPLPIRHQSKSRRGSPPRSLYREEDYEEIRYKDVDSEDEYREMHIRRRKNRHRRKSRARSEVRSRRSSSSSSSSSFEKIPPVNSKGKPGRTRMPKRLVHISAILELGYPYEEEEDFYIVQRALDKEQIDKVMQITETYRDKSTSFRYEHQETDTRPRRNSLKGSHKKREHSRSSKSEVIYVPSSDAPSVKGSSSARNHSPSRHREIEERFEESNHIGGPLTVILPERKHRSTRDMESDIRHLERERERERERDRDRERERERERRDSRFERDSDNYDYELVEYQDSDRNVLRIDRDRKGRLALVRSAH